MSDVTICPRCEQPWAEHAQGIDGYSPKCLPTSSAAHTELPSFARGEQGNIILRWRCEACGWEVEIETPGYAGTGYHHFPDGQTPCGPLVASRV